MKEQDPKEEDMKKMKRDNKRLSQLLMNQNLHIKNLKEL